MKSHYPARRVFKVAFSNGLIALHKFLSVPDVQRVSNGRLASLADSALPKSVVLIAQGNRRAHHIS